jgi:hypothetical protein
MHIGQLLFGRAARLRLLDLVSLAVIDDALDRCRRELNVTA